MPSLREVRSIITRPAEDDAAYLRGMERLVEAVRDLARARPRRRVEIVRSAAREVVDADGATFVLRDEGRCYYVDEDAIAPLWRGLRLPMEACISGWAMLNARQVVIGDIHRRADPARGVPADVRAQPGDDADPYGGPGRRIGTYWASRREATPAELKLLQALADSMAVALEKRPGADRARGAGGHPARRRPRRPRPGSSDSPRTPPRARDAPAAGVAAGLHHDHARAAHRVRRGPAALDRARGPAGDGGGLGDGPAADARRGGPRPRPRRRRGGRARGGLRFPADSTISWRAVRAGRPVLVPDVRTHPGRAAQESAYDRLLAVVAELEPRLPAVPGVCFGGAIAPSPSSAAVR